ncbi:MAG: hypothetical protein HY223_10325 [Thaumarchaeota archaeon]|nr:hypothetical protein [Nitrososphaerota archaeon]
MGELNAELFTCVTRILRSIDDYCEKYHISIPDDPKVEYLVEQALSLIYEINGRTPTNRKLTDRKSTDKLPPPPPQNNIFNRYPYRTIR